MSTTTDPRDVTGPPIEDTDTGLSRLDVSPGGDQAPSFVTETVSADDAPDAEPAHPPVETGVAWDKAYPSKRGSGGFVQWDGRNFNYTKSELNAAEETGEAQAERDAENAKAEGPSGA